MLGEVIRLTVWGIIVLLIEMGASFLLEIRGIRPDLLLLFALAVTVRHNRYVGLGVGFGVGLIQDGLTLGILGVYVLAKSTVIFWAGVWLDKQDRPLTLLEWFIAGIVLTCGQELIAGSIHLLGTNISFSGYFFRTILPTAFYTGIIGFLWALSPLGYEPTKQQQRSRPTRRTGSSGSRRKNERVLK
ncbi:MAG: rod shape-determining protein MreD [Candidatus Electryoneaceae bacterium]|nr:rod shape-determining protein MreD [Candidatus Electryoneaceae bacterium]